MRPMICDELERRGIVLQPKGERLVYQAPQGTMTPDLLADLRRYKPDLLAYLNALRRSAIDLVVEYFDGELVDLTDIEVHLPLFTNGFFGPDAVHYDRMLRQHRAGRPLWAPWHRWTPRQTAEPICEQIKDEEDTQRDLFEIE